MQLIHSLRSEARAALSALPALLADHSRAVLGRLRAADADAAELVARYRRELAERRRLFNLVQELRGNIRVYCRSRPASGSELAAGHEVIVDFNPDDVNYIGVTNERRKKKTFEFDHVRLADRARARPRRRAATGGRPGGRAARRADGAGVDVSTARVPARPRARVCSQVFPPSSSQADVFREVEPLITSALDGFNVCIFAYGQTGSGKTFTMTGPAADRGVNHRALATLFARAAERRSECTDVITVSILEIYNEQIRDLLAEAVGSRKLEVRQGPNGMFVPDLTLVPVTGVAEVLELMELGEMNRATDATDMNEHSSRSHSLLSIYLHSTNHVTGSVSRGKLHLVDLAGSERLAKSGATGQRQKEAAHINKSLSALGDVIAARANKAGHVPYRNSTLTYLLQDSLSADSKTLMFVCCSPVVYNAEETLCSLNFASRVRTVELGQATKHVAAGAGPGAPPERDDVAPAAAAGGGDAAASSGGAPLRAAATAAAAGGVLLARARAAKK